MYFKLLCNLINQFSCIPTYQKYNQLLVLIRSVFPYFKLLNLKDLLLKVVLDTSNVP